MDRAGGRQVLNRNVSLLNAIALCGNLFFERAIWMIYLTEQGYSLLQIGLLQSILHATRPSQLPAATWDDTWR